MQNPQNSLSQAESQAANRRLGLILASIAVVFFLGFYAKMVFFG